MLWNFARRNRTIVAVVQSALWLKDGMFQKPRSSPNWWKRRLLLSLAKKFEIVNFIETGTYMGDTAHLMAKRNLNVFTIEVDNVLAMAAEDRFRKFQNVHVFKGDSSNLLDEITKEIEGSTLFWLDGHYSMGVTSRGLNSSPLSNELQILKQNLDQNVPQVVVIDDIQSINGKDGYPHLTEIQEWATALKLTVTTRGSVIILSPSRNLFLNN